MDLVAELHAVVRALDSCAIPYAVCGGIAVVIHGHVRATKDIDLLVRPEDMARTLAALEPIGYDMRAHPMTFGAATPKQGVVQRVTKVDPPTTLTVDLLEVNAAYQGLFDDRELYEWQGARLTVVSRAGLIVMKTIAGRTQDLADIEALREVGDG